MDKPVVSILIPAYNAAAYLPQCLDSILKQTYRDLQVVIVDDGSKDNTLEVCRECAEKDARIEVYNQENQGVAATRNHLLDKVKGDYVLFVDADDWIELDMVEYLVNLAQSHSADFVMCDRVINDTKPSREESKVFELKQEQAIVDFLQHDYFVGALWNKLFKRDVTKEIRFNKEIWYGEDALFTWGVLQNTRKVVVSSKQLYHYRMNEDSISHQSFGEKKLTSRKAWAIIQNEVESNYPQHKDIVYATIATNELGLIQAAAQSDYPYNEEVALMQKTIRRYHHLLTKLKKKDFKRWLYASIVMYWYAYGKLYFKMHKLIKGRK